MVHGVGHPHHGGSKEASAAFGAVWDKVEQTRCPRWALHNDNCNAMLRNHNWRATMFEVAWRRAMEDSKKAMAPEPGDGFFVCVDGEEFFAVHGVRGEDMPLAIDGKWTFDFDQEDAVTARLDELRQTEGAAKARRAELKRMTRMWQQSQASSTARTRGGCLAVCSQPQPKHSSAREERSSRND
jgi:hypothetical protein